MTIEEIQKQCREWASSHLSTDFKFRPHQLLTTAQIVANSLDGVKTQVMNAPTGTGKSITGIVAAGVLNQFYGKTSYILVSDLSLFKQYESDIARFNLPWGCLKGKDNYVCSRNGNIVANADCALQQVKFSSLADKSESENCGFSCAHECDYVKKRASAQESPVTVMTYQLWLIQMNYVSDLVGENYAPFKKRDLVICDEAHKLNDIVQAHFAPRIHCCAQSWMDTLKKWGRENGEKVPNTSIIPQIFKSLSETNDNEKILELMAKYEQILAGFLTINEKLREFVKDDEKLAKELSRQLFAGNTAREQHCKFDDFFKLVREYGKAIVVKTNGEKEIVINCVYEDKMVKKYFHDKCKTELLMSATIGNEDTYKNMIGMKFCKKSEWVFYDIPSTFDFSKSPIYFSTKNPMSWDKKAASITPICDQIEEICRLYENCRGIIQTGNYENSRKLLERSPDKLKQRFIIYGSAKDKDFALQKFMKSENGILVGPTLLEGLNFDGDKCRFSICMKLPYASLASNLVKAKMKMIRGWYTYDVVSRLEQGFGRGVRFNGDWCVNYILDGCVANILKRDKNMFCSETQKRFIQLA